MRNRQQGSARRRLKALFVWIVQRFRKSADSEHEMVLNRLVICGLMAAYFVAALAMQWSVDGAVIGAIALVALVSVGFAIHIVIRPTASIIRRALAVLIDLGGLSYAIHAGGETASLFYPIYLWVIFGNGFRFGLPYLFLAMAIGVAGFSVAVATTEFWSVHLRLAAGLMLGLIILPLYATTLIRKLSKARHRAEEANRAKTLFLASVSHELRTPLNAVIGLSDLLSDTSLDAEQRDMTRIIGASGRSLLTMINTLLDFSRLEADRMPSHLAEFDLYALVEHVRAMLSVQAQSKGLHLSTHITARTPRLLRGDKRHVEEIIINLCANAVKFTAHGYVAIAIDAVAHEAERVRLRLEVSDTGIGIAPEAQGRIFDSFTQADETIIDRFGGTGLGLAIVKQLVQLHGGTIGVESTPGAGSTFWCEIDVETSGAGAIQVPTVPVIAIAPDISVAQMLRELGVIWQPAAHAGEAAAVAAQCQRETQTRAVVLIDEGDGGDDVMAAAADLREAPHAPRLVLLRRDDVRGLPRERLRTLFDASLEKPLTASAMARAMWIAHGEPPASTDQHSGASTASRSLHVLVAEDNRTNQKVIAKILERAGHRVYMADNGETALDALEQRPFDIVLMDINMPVMNGIEATKLYRFASLGSRHVPILALTADATPEIRARCEEAGMDACLVKPIEPARLLQVIDGLVPADAGLAITPRAAADSEPGEAPAAEAPTIDGPTLEALAELGGADFVAELASQFVGDAAGVLHDLAAAATNTDVQSFREQAHALRSAAANIGAKRIYEMCLSWRQMQPDDLAHSGAEYVAQLKAEFDEVRAALKPHLPKPAAQAPQLTVIDGGRLVG